MSNQYHFEHESSLRESPADQAVRIFSRDWETTNDQIDFFSDPLEGKIIAQMPDLGECRTISEARQSYQQQSGKWLNRIYSGLTLISYFPKYLRQVLPNVKLRKSPFSFMRQQKFYRNLIVLCLVVLIIGGGILIYNTNKKERKETARRVPDQNTVQNVKSPESASTPAENPTTPPATPSTTPPVTPSPQKTVTPTVEKSATSSAEKPAISSVEKPAAAPIITVAVISPKVSETKKKDRNNVNSPWERSATDNYSPWPMDTQSRLEAAATSEAAGVSATSVNQPVPSAPAPPVPLTPMTHLVPNRPEIPENAAVNNNIVNPVNNTVPVTESTVSVVPNVNPAVVNNTIPLVNNIDPLANNTVANNISNNTVTQSGLPQLPNANGVVTVYSQHNVPSPYDYRATTYERTNIPSVPAAVPPTLPTQPVPPTQLMPPVYTPQTYNGQPVHDQQLQNQLGQYQQQYQQPNQQQIVLPSYQGTPTVNAVPTADNITIPVPMYGVAPQPQPVPMTGTAPIPIQPVAPIHGTASLPIPQEIITPPTVHTGMVTPPAGTMPMSQPIPTQVIASAPPTYYSQPPVYSYPVHPANANVPSSPSYYPPAVAVPYYQQGNTNTSVPHRWLY
ncbi:MAG: hypothetical protein LBG58_11585 [Planctomycetaceae bacterium]|jgi:hypothetical protein|nr:hypothetical protein [Planctomycetaceae bacterium]